MNRGVVVNEARALLPALLMLAIPAARGWTQGTAAPTTARQAAVRVNASSTSMSVVSIPLPAVFPPGARVSYTVTPLIDGAVLGRLSGDVITAEGITPTILFAVRAPRYAPAGQLEVARVRFSATTVAVRFLSSPSWKPYGPSPSRPARSSPWDARECL